MPKVATSVSDEDIRRSYYEKAGYSMWITEMQLDPLQLIVSDDSTGKNFRVPVTLKGSEFEFGEPIEVQVQYVDASKASRASAITYASRDESTKGLPAHKPISAADAARQIHNAPVANGGGSTTQEGPNMDPAQLREALGLSEAEVSAFTKVVSLLNGQTTPDPNPSPPAPPTPNPNPTPAPPSPPAPGGETLTPTIDAVAVAAASKAARAAGVALVDPSELSRLRAAAENGNRAFEQLNTNRCEQVIEAAVKAGKFAPARADHYRMLWKSDPEGAEQTINDLQGNLVPVAASGYGAGAPESETDMIYKAMGWED